MAYGACAMDGGIPALANLKSPAEIYDAVYHSNPTLQNPNKTEPQPSLADAAGRPDASPLLPAGAPARGHRPGGLPDARLPSRRRRRSGRCCRRWRPAKCRPRNDEARVGCDDKSVCDECHREKRKTRISEFKRPHLAVPEPNLCLLEQGFVCLGAATRSGCGALCTKAELACRGCYGAAGAARDQGTAMLSAIGSLIDATTEEQAREIVDQIADPTGTFYRFSLASSALKAHR